VRGRLWRCPDPRLPAERRSQLIGELMNARRDKGRAIRADNPEARELARRRVDEAKRALGERDAVWWTDGALDCNRHMACNTPYVDWFVGLVANHPS
jgi:hypothetical protein